MASTLMKSVSGIRGIVGDSMTPDLVVRVAGAFARYCKYGTVVVGRDTRITGGMIENMFESTLALSGCRVIRLGIVPTPTVQIMVEEMRASGGVVISASHNPIEWNAFKLISAKGTFLNQAEMNAFLATIDSQHPAARWNKIGAIEENNNADAIHITRVLDTVNVKKIRGMRFRVALDPVGGAGAVITQKLLKELGCDIVPVNCEVTGTFPRGAEPLAANLADLSRAVIESSVHVGFAQDPDADRLAIVDEQGRPIGEENTIALVVEHLLNKKPGRVVINLSTTRAVDDIAAKYKSPLTRAKVGEINVVEEMRRGGARIGGEGNGGVISPEVHLGRDSLVGIGYILEMMAERKAPVSGLVAELPGYIMKKGKVKLGDGIDVTGTLEKIRREFGNETISDIDGLRIDFAYDARFSGGWVHLRSSNTEPIFRIITEGRDERHASRIYKHFAGLFKK